MRQSTRKLAGKLACDQSTSKLIAPFNGKNTQIGEWLHTL